MINPPASSYAFQEQAEAFNTEAFDVESYEDDSVSVRSEAMPLETTNRTACTPRTKHLTKEQRKAVVPEDVYDNFGELPQRNLMAVTEFKATNFAFIVKDPSYWLTFLKSSGVAMLVLSVAALSRYTISESQAKIITDLLNRSVFYLSMWMCFSVANRRHFPAWISATKVLLLHVLSSVGSCPRILGLLIAYEIISVFFI